MERTEINHLCDIMARLIPFPVYVMELDTGHILYAYESHSGEFIGGYPASDAVDKGWRFLHEIISPEMRSFIDDAINVIRDFSIQKTLIQTKNILPYRSTAIF